MVEIFVSAANKATEEKNNVWQKDSCLFSLTGVQIWVHAGLLYSLRNCGIFNFSLNKNLDLKNCYKRMNCYSNLLFPFWLTPILTKFSLMKNPPSSNLCKILHLFFPPVVSKTVCQPQIPTLWLSSHIHILLISSLDFFSNNQYWMGYPIV